MAVEVQQVEDDQEAADEPVESPKEQGAAEEQVEPSDDGGEPREVDHAIFMRPKSK